VDCPAFGTIHLLQRGATTADVGAKNARASHMPNANVLENIETKSNTQTQMLSFQAPKDGNVCTSIDLGEIVDGLPFIDIGRIENAPSIKGSGPIGIGAGIARNNHTAEWSNPRTWLSMKPRSNTFFTRSFKSLMPSIAVALCQPTQT
jgi:hypothetical protein